MTKVADPIQELKVLFPDKNLIHGYTVKKYRVGEFMRAIAITSRNVGLFSDDFGAYLMTVGESAMDDIIELVLFSTDVPASAIEAMDLDKFIAILAKVFEVNITFFSQAVEKALADLKADLNQSQEVGEK